MNSYLTGHNYEDYISKTLLKVFQDTMDSFEKRMARQMFKQSVEISKIFRLIIKELEIDPEDADTLHADCVEEVKKINGAIQFPYNVCRRCPPPNRRRVSFQNFSGGHNLPPKPRGANAPCDYCNLSQALLFASKAGALLRFKAKE